MKKLLLVFLVAMLAVFAVTINSDSSTVEGSEKAVIYYIPHPDDEILTFGVSIFAHLQNAQNVHLVLLTNGEASYVKKRLGMDEKEFGEARNREFTMSAQKLGVKQENIHYLDLGDGNIQQSDMEQVISEYEAAYPNASHKAFSWTDPHADHANTGLALKALSDAGVVSDARYYVKQQDTHRAPSRLMKDRYQGYFHPFIVASARVYQIDNPRIGFYGIGYKSVPGSFRSIEARPASYYHK